jgi:flagellar basal-body rod protein FlgB
MFNDVAKAQIGRLGGYLDMITSRQQLTAKNIANMHTPNYHAQHVSFADLLGGGGSGGNKFETSLAKKMGGQGLAAHLGQTEADQGVVLQDEMMDMQMNSLYYSIVSRRLSVLLSGLKQAGQVGR